MAVSKMRDMSQLSAHPSYRLQWLKLGIMRVCVCVFRRWRSQTMCSDEAGGDGSEGSPSRGNTQLRLTQVSIRFTTAACCLGFECVPTNTCPHKATHTHLSQCTLMSIHTCLYRHMHM